MDIEFDEAGYLVLDGFSADEAGRAGVPDRSSFVDPPALPDGAWDTALAAAIDGSEDVRSVDELLEGPGGPAGTGAEVGEPGGAGEAEPPEDVPDDPGWSDDAWAGDSWLRDRSTDVDLPPTPGDASPDTLL